MSEKQHNTGLHVFLRERIKWRPTLRDDQDVKAVSVKTDDMSSDVTASVHNEAVTWVCRDQGPCYSVAVVAPPGKTEIRTSVHFIIRPFDSSVASYEATKTHRTLNSSVKLRSRKLCDCFKC